MAQQQALVRGGGLEGTYVDLLPGSEMRRAIPTRVTLAPVAPEIRYEVYRKIRTGRMLDYGYGPTPEYGYVFHETREW